MYRELNTWPGLPYMLPAFIFLYLLLVCGQAGAAHQAYGERFVRLGKQWSEGNNGWQPVPPSLSEGELRDNRARMESLEVRGGPYEDGLAEPLGALGRYHREQGEYTQALAAYRRALHVVRINDGLYSERQIPLVRELLSTFRAAGDYEALDQRYDYFFRLYGNGKPPFTALRIRASLEYLRWQREALRLKLDGDGKERLLELIELNKDLLEGVNADPQAAYEWQRDLTYSQLRNFYILGHRFKPALQDNGLVSSKEMMGVAPQGVDFEAKRLDGMVRAAPAGGTALLEQLRAKAAGQGAVELASLQLAQADWHWWNGNRRPAGEAYNAVVATLLEAGESELVQDWLGQPVELPDNGVFWQPVNGEKTGKESVRATFDVSARGRARNIEAQTLEEDPEFSLSGFRRGLAKTLFRPRWAGGKAEEVSGLQRDYQLYR